MDITQKELAFLRELYIQDDWTRRFTELVDKRMDLSDAENLLYINAGPGGHAMALDEKFGEKTDIFASCENDDLLMIARDKAAAISSKVDFSNITFEEDSFDAVLADGSFIRPDDIVEFIDDAVRVARVGSDIALFLPAGGSFGEVFSLMWEAFYSEGLEEHAASIERLIAAIPTISRFEELAAAAGIVNIHTESAPESFEFESGAEFINSPLVSNFLMAVWMEGLSEDEKERVEEQLARLIDAEDGDLTFRFSIKAMLLTGQKG